MNKVDWPIKILLLVLAIASFTKNGMANEPTDAKTNKPNIVLILVDDLGFSDLGCYGSEIRTPNLDKMAKNGIRFTQFYNCAKCETTRATMLSGQYYPEVKNRDLANCVTLAEAMKHNGYQTIMTGKWHLKDDPIERGFDRYFGHLSGATNFFTGDDTFRLNQEKFTVPEKDFYTTDANTSYALKFLEESRKQEKPFFLYLAYNAPHYPLQAPESDVKRYEGKYSGGWDKLRQERFERQKKMGLLLENAKLSERPDDVPKWNSLTPSQKKHEDLMMATYAGMIDRVDQNIGRLVFYMHQEKMLDNTLFLFLSDNGACPFQRSKPKTKSRRLKPWDPESYWTYDKGWAHACNTPFREYKQNQHEGGITTPCIAFWPAGIPKEQQGKFVREPAHLVDIMTTFIDVADGKYPKSRNGKPIGRPRGVSLAPLFAGESIKRTDPLFFSFYGKNNAIREGDWKLVNKNFGDFELYDLSNDRSETKDLARIRPTKFREMKDKLNAMSGEVGQVIRNQPPKKNQKGKAKKK